MKIVIMEKSQSATETQYPQLVHIVNFTMSRNFKKADRAETFWIECVQNWIDNWNLSYVGGKLLDYLFLNVGLVMWICLIMANVFLCFWKVYFPDSKSYVVSYVDDELLDYFFSMLDWSIRLVWLWWIDFSVSEKYISLIQKVMWVMSMASCWIICFPTTRPLVIWICLIVVNVFLCLWTKYFSDSRSYVNGKLLDYLFPDHLSVGQLLLPAGNSTIPSISGSRVCHTYKSVWHTFESVRHTLKSVCSRVCHQCATQICLAHLSLCHTCYMVQ